MTDLPPSEKTLDSCSTSTSTCTPPDEQPPSLTRNLSLSKLNAKAPEFVPMKSQSPPPISLAAADHRLQTTLVHVYPPTPLPMPIPIRPPPPFPPHLHHHHHHQHQHQPHRHHQHQKQQHHHRQQQQQEGVHTDKDHESGSSRSSSNNNNHTNINNGLSDEASQKLINQVEYYFSDVNLATTEHLIRFIFKDPDGFVPIYVVASFKKIKALISSNSQLAAVLKNSTKLVVSEDRKKVKRLHALTGSDFEELQARIIVAENLPEDHCHQNLMKIFSAVGSVKSIRTCQPQPSSNVASSATRSSKNDNMPYNDKLHAYVEYDSVELAEKAILELNDENSWRNGLRVRPLPKQVIKPAQGRTKKAGNESDNCEEDMSTSDLHQNEKQSESLKAEPDIHSHEQGEEQNLEKEGGQKKSRNRTRGKGRGRGHNHNHHQNQNSRGSHPSGPSMSNMANSDQPVKQQPPGPRMPDGTRGFCMGRGRPIFNAA